MAQQKYVLVVCGDDWYIEQLNFSIKLLQKFTSKDIIVVTDTARNKVAINHSKVLDIRTDERYDHHEASIYLKTSLHQQLEPGPTYCYLDTDVVAVREGVDSIFGHRKGVINFAPDVTRLRRFSNYAVNCKCLEKNQQKLEYLNGFIAKWDTNRGIDDKDMYQKYQKVQDIKQEYYETLAKLRSERVALLLLIKAWEDNHQITDQKLLDDRKRLEKYLYEPEYQSFTRNPKAFLEKKWVLKKDYGHDERTNIWYDKEGQILIDKENEFDNFFSKRGYEWRPEKEEWAKRGGGIIIFTFDNFISERSNFSYNEPEKKWYDESGALIEDENIDFYQYILMNTGFTWDTENETWLDEEGDDILITQCNHLADAILEKFDVVITEPNWQQWNGGVFLFDEASYDFMEAWHQRTLSIFDEPYWKTRDQGTLIATTWAAGLNNMQLLPQEYNLLVDDQIKDYQYKSPFQYSYDDHETIIKPYFIHFFDHFADSNEPAWMDVEALLKDDLA